MFDLILYVPSTIFQLNRDGYSGVEPVLSLDKCVLLKDHNAVTPVRLEPAASRSRVKNSTTEPLGSQEEIALWTNVFTDNMHLVFVACFLLCFFLKKKQNKKQKKTKNRVDKHKMPSKLFS